VVLCLVLGVVLRVPSYLDLAGQTQRRRWWRRRCGLKAPISHDTFEYVTERLCVADLRHSLACVAKTLKANKALESCKVNGLLFVSLDANEHFHSRSRCCACCCQRQVGETDTQGQMRIRMPALRSKVRTAAWKVVGAEGFEPPTYSV
jgi:hypothetical protein